MILTVTCNPALDISYELPSLTPGAVHRVARVKEVAGGKGVNVARVLHQLGRSTRLTGLATGSFNEDLRFDGLDARFVEVLPSVRRTLVIVEESGATTSLWEPGPQAPALAADALEQRVNEQLADATGLVVSGSLPRGVDASVPTRLAQLAHAAGLPAVLDLDGAPLHHAVTQRAPALLMPNIDELTGLLGITASFDAVEAGRRLAALVTRPVLITLGAHGLLGINGDEVWHVAPLRKLRGNPTGAGDAAAAAAAWGLAQGDSWSRIVVEAVALSAAAVVRPTAGSVDLPTYESWKTALRAERPETLFIER
ncbi:hexose kinase [uncultured Aeromicrobium sp.]|uniref:hexose kinase n=1 Tax=uncultured Aeromicrobium sp. TaxID=337820 RepID=UPI0025D61F50|nr:hexose kinase [uncultured Aeromicrobium sp.]